MSALPFSCEFAFLLVHADGPRGVGVHLCLRHAADLVAAPVCARYPLHAELPRQLALHRDGRHRLQRTEDRAQARRVKRAPLPVARGAGDTADLVVNVILRIAIPAGALQPGRDDQPCSLEPAGLLPVDTDSVIPGTGDSGPDLHVLQRRPVGPVQHLLEPLLAPGPVRRRLVVTGQSGPARVFPDRGVQDRYRLGERDSHVGIDGGLASCLGRLAFKLDQTFCGGVGLGGRQPRQMIGEPCVLPSGPAKPLPGPRVPLLIHRVVRLALDDLACPEAQGFGSGTPPPAWWFPRLGSVNVVPATGALGTGLALGLPDVVEVVALGHRHDHGHQMPPSRSRGRGTDHDHLDQCNGLRGWRPW